MAFPDYRSILLVECNNCGIFASGSHQEAFAHFGGVFGALRYENYRELVTSDQLLPYAYGGNADHDRVSFVANAVARYEYMPQSFLTLVLIHPITHVVFGDKWLPALPLFYFLWGANLFVPTATPLMGLLNALGLSRVTFGFTVLWMAMTWLIAAPGILRFGALGFAAANLIVQLSNVWLYRLAQRRVPFRLRANVLPQWGAALVAGAVTWGIAHLVALTTLPRIVACGIVGGAPEGMDGA